MHTRYSARFLLLACLASTSIGCQFMPDSMRQIGRKDEEFPLETPRERVVALREMQKSKNLAPSSRDEKVQALAKDLLNEPDALVRIEIVRTLGTMNTPTSTAALRQALHDSDSDVRIVACDSLGKIGGQEAVTALGTVLAEDQDVDVRLAAARALGETGDAAAVNALATTLDDPDPALQCRGMQSLSEVSGRDYGGDVNKWRQYVQTGNAPEPDTSIAGRLRRLF